MHPNQVVARVTAAIESQLHIAPDGYLRRQASEKILDLLFPRRESARAFRDLSEAQLFALLAAVLGNNNDVIPSLESLDRRPISEGQGGK